MSIRSFFTRRIMTMSMAKSMPKGVPTHINERSHNHALSRLSMTNNHLRFNHTTGASSSSSSSSSSTAAASTTESSPNETTIKTPQSAPLVIATNQGTKYTATYANYATTDSGKIISYFHDIDLGLDLVAKEANFVCEIPRWSNAKFEILRNAPGNPIVQDSKNGKVRFVKNLFPHHGYIHNYGAFPQTWEDPTEKHYDLFGDNDPLDVCEIGSDILSTGDVKRVKILGSLALIDDGELDWKVIVVDIKDSLASEVNDIDDLREKCPGLLEATKQWFKDYKLADEKPENKFAFEGKYKNANETLEIVQGCHDSWKQLVLGNKNGSEIKQIPAITNTTLKETPGYVEKFDLELNNPAQPDAAFPVGTNRSYFFKPKA